MANVKNRASVILADRESIENEMSCVNEAIRTLSWCHDGTIDPSAALYVVERLSNLQDILEDELAKLDKYNKYCNTEHCAAYAQGTCPFINHAECPKYKKHEE